MNKNQKPLVDCIQCGTTIDRRTDKYAALTSGKCTHVKYACKDCMDKPVLVYWISPNKELKGVMEKIARSHRLDWKKFPRGTEVQEMRFGTKLILTLMKELEMEQAKP